MIVLYSDGFPLEERLRLLIFFTGMPDRVHQVWIKTKIPGRQEPLPPFPIGMYPEGDRRKIMPAEIPVDLRIPEPGDLVFEVLLEETTLAEIRIPVFQWEGLPG